MHFQSSLFASALTIALASALPTDTTAQVKRTPTDLAPRCGTTAYPSYISWIDSSSPNVPKGATNVISTNANPPNGPFRVAEVQFQIPSGAGGPCQLEFDFPAGASIITSGHTQLQVYKVSSNISPSDTWGNAPTPTFLFGTFNPVAGTSGFVNSEGCSTTLNYFVQVFEQWQLTSGSTVAGSVQFTENPSPPPAELGLKVVYGC